MTILYRIISFLINIGAMLLAFTVVFMFPLALTAPPLLLPTFVLVAIILYTWFSSKFRRSVLERKEEVKLSLRDWVRVNGFVAIAFSILNIPSFIALIFNPTALINQMNEFAGQLGEQYQQGLKAENLTVVGAIMLVYFIALLIHVIWTFALLKKHREFFK